MPAKQRLMQTSSASAHLKGFLYQGKPIDEVLRGSGTKRVIRFTDGSKVTADRGTIADLARLKGLLDYRGKYQAARGAAKRLMLRKSEKRQQVLLSNMLGKRLTEIGAMPVGQQTIAKKEFAKLRRKGKQVGSPLVGKLPASSIWGTGATFKTAKDAGITFRVMTIRGKRRVIPMRS